jgi:PRC-barrel domain
MMRKGPLAAAILAAGLATTSAFAQQSTPPAQPPAQTDTKALVGLPVYSSDGEKLGEVTEVGTSGGQQAVRADFGTFLGMGPTAVIIGADVFQQKPDRIEVAMTAAQVKDTVSKQKEQQPKQ